MDKQDYFVTIKAVGDWELDVLAVPFGARDADGQWFDDRTDIADNAFTTPLVVYQHGIAQGAKALDEQPQIVGRAVPGTLEKRLDGWHIRVILDKAKEAAKRIMEAVRAKMVAVSSGSISHLARLDIGGKLIQYEKDRPGRIAVWPLAEISIWEKGNGNVQPASQFAVALPAMKAIYREAGLPFPELEGTSDGDKAEEVRRRAQAAKQKSKQLLRSMQK